MTAAKAVLTAVLFPDVVPRRIDCGFNKSCSAGDPCLLKALHIAWKSADPVVCATCLIAVSMHRQRITDPPSTVHAMAPAI